MTPDEIKAILDADEPTEKFKKWHKEKYTGWCQHYWEIYQKGICDAQRTGVSEDSLENFVYAFCKTYLKFIEKKESENV